MISRRCRTAVASDSARTTMCHRIMTVITEGHCVSVLARRGGGRRRSRLRAKLLAVNEYADRVGCAPIPQAKLDGILGDNYARMLGLLPA